eukprot:gb/GEZN01006754.1/.p1 GENE.gb/GEZN01006754.1/~~gb/GEZN01006754.1/.p1  ORF type:complete len:398 (-),score=19.57 gb/GEZN01006754.1/:379-1572(-)
MATEARMASFSTTSSTYSDLSSTSCTLSPARSAYSSASPSYRSSPVATPVMTSTSRGIMRFNFPSRSASKSPSSSSAPTSPRRSRRLSLSAVSPRAFLRKMGSGSTSPLASLPTSRRGSVESPKVLIFGRFTPRGSAESSCPEGLEPLPTLPQVQVRSSSRDKSRGSFLPTSEPSHTSNNDRQRRSFLRRSAVPTNPPKLSREPSNSNDLSSSWRKSAPAFLSGDKARTESMQVLNATTVNINSTPVISASSDTATPIKFPQVLSDIKTVPEGRGRCYSVSLSQEWNATETMEIVTVETPTRHFIRKKDRRPSLTDLMGQSEPRLASPTKTTASTADASSPSSFKFVRNSLQFLKANETKERPLDTSHSPDSDPDFVSAFFEVDDGPSRSHLHKIAR